MSRAAESEDQRITRWRRDVARKLGFEFSEVEIIGNEWHIDLERLRDLIENRKCRPSTALRILR